MHNSDVLGLRLDKMPVSPEHANPSYPSQLET